MTTEEAKVQQLSDDVLAEILSRLPVKILVRFTSVCKTWLFLIRSPEFATKQLGHTRARLSMENFQYFIMNKRGSVYLFSYNSFDISTKFVCTPCCSIFMSNPCDGIVCMYVYDHNLDAAFLLWNPATREVKEVPYLLPPRISTGKHPVKFDVRAVGFGYDSVSKDYKVVVPLEPRVYLSDYYPVEVYSLRDDCWKLLPEDSLHEPMLPRRGGVRHVTLHGRMCNWIAESSDSLISFDLSREVFLKTSLSELYNGDMHYSAPLLLQSNKSNAMPRVLRTDFIHIPVNEGDLTNIEIWELDAYGSEGRWTKQVVIEFPYSETILHVLGYWQDEELLVQLDVSEQSEAKYRIKLPIKLPLVTYSPVKKQFRTILFENNAFEFQHGCGYIESLVSIRGECRQHEELDQSHDNPDSLKTFSFREACKPANPSDIHRYHVAKWHRW